jgi:hypothetical protein
MLFPDTLLPANKKGTSLLSLERLSLDERTGKVAYRYGKEAKEMERMDYLEFIARTPSGSSPYGHWHRGRIMLSSA